MAEADRISRSTLKLINKRLEIRKLDSKEYANPRSDQKAFADFYENKSLPVAV